MSRKAVGQSKYSYTLDVLFRAPDCADAFRIKPSSLSFTSEHLSVAFLRSYYLTLQTGATLFVFLFAR